MGDKLTPTESRVTAPEKIKALADENVILRHQCKTATEDALKMLSAYDQMRGQYNAMFECAAELKKESPSIWECYFSKAAKRRRLRDGVDVRKPTKKTKEPTP